MEARKDMRKGRTRRKDEIGQMSREVWKDLRQAWRSITGPLNCA